MGSTATTENRETSQHRGERAVRDATLRGVVIGHPD